jgi:hypothetical protein
MRVRRWESYITMIICINGGRVSKLFWLANNMRQGQFDLSEGNTLVDDSFNLNDDFDLRTKNAMIMNDILNPVFGQGYEFVPDKGISVNKPSTQTIHLREVNGAPLV